jgi:hypothetical protein
MLAYTYSLSEKNRFFKLCREERYFRSRALYYGFNKSLTLSNLPFFSRIPRWGSFNRSHWGVGKGTKMAKKVNNAPKLTVAAGTQTVFFSQGMHYNKR